MGEAAAVEDSDHVDVRFRGNRFAEAVEVDGPIDLSEGLSLPIFHASVPLEVKEDESGDATVIPKSLIVIKVEQVVAVVED